MPSHGHSKVVGPLNTTSHPANPNTNSLFDASIDESHSLAADCLVRNHHQHHHHQHQRRRPSSVAARRVNQIATTLKTKKKVDRREVADIAADVYRHLSSEDVTASSHDAFAINDEIVQAAVRETHLTPHRRPLPAPRPTTHPTPLHVMHDLHRIFHSGAAGHDELVALLLREARRRQWENAAKGNFGSLSFTLAQNSPSQSHTHGTHNANANTSTSPRRRNTGSTDIDAAHVMREMYDRITPAGAADAEGMLDVLLREAKAAAAADAGASSAPSQNTETETEKKKRRVAAKL